MLRGRSGLSIRPPGVASPGEGASVIVAFVLNLLRLLLFPLHALVGVDDQRAGARD